jgi:hypothetical protein
MVPFGRNDERVASENQQDFVYPVIHIDSIFSSRSPFDPGNRGFESVVTRRWQTSKTARMLRFGQVGPPSNPRLSSSPTPCFGGTLLGDRAWNRLALATVVLLLLPRRSAISEYPNGPLKV